MWNNMWKLTQLLWDINIEDFIDLYLSLFFASLGKASGME